MNPKIPTAETLNDGSKYFNVYVDGENVALVAWESEVKDFWRPKVPHLIAYGRRTMFTVEDAEIYVSVLLEAFQTAIAKLREWQAEWEQLGSPNPWHITPSQAEETQNA